MSERAYLSNLSPLWPAARQEALLLEAFPAWPKGVTVFRDDIDARDRRGHSTELLVKRSEMLRGTTRKGHTERITLASLAVLAWSAEDMLECLTLALSRGATVRVLDVGLSIPPTPDAVILHEAAKAFRTSRTRGVVMDRGKAGGMASAAQRIAEAKAKAETIRAEWALPSDDYPTLDLLAKAGISRNTARLYLGKRDVAQREHQAALKRRETNATKKAARAAKEKPE